MRRLMLACLVSLLVAGCQKPVHALAGSRSTVLGRAPLITQYVLHAPTRRKVPLLQVLFVPDWNLPPGSGHGTGGGVPRGTLDRMEIDCMLWDDGRQVTTQPIQVLDGETVRAAGRTWDLRRGNLFVAIVNPSGSLRITQLSTNETTPAGVLAFVKRSLPAEPRVQALEVKR